MSCINVSLQRIGKSPTVSVVDITERFTIDCSILCDIISMFYLYVNPEMIWINKDNMSQFDILANVKWEIK